MTDRAKKSHVKIYPAKIGAPNAVSHPAILPVISRIPLDRPVNARPASSSENGGRAKLNGRIDVLVSALPGWFSRNARDLPWRHTRDPYAIWVSEIMLQQTQVKTVVLYWTRWMRALPDIAALAKANPEHVLKLWEGLGYYRRARDLQTAAQQIMDEHGARFPRKYEDILALPGVGRYTAGAVCSIAFNQPKPVLDGNVIRVFTRFFGIVQNPRARNTNNRLWQLAEQLVTQAAAFYSKDPQNSKFICSQINQSVMELGALICRPRGPDCNACPVSEFCVACRRGWQGKLPNLGKRAISTRRRFVGFVVKRRGRYLVRQRSANAINPGLWEFPNVEIPSPDVDALRSACLEVGLSSQSVKLLCTVRHSITRYRILLEAYQVRTEARLTKSRLAGEWLTHDKLKSLPFTSAHRRILDCL